MVELFNGKEILDFAKNAWSQSVLILMIFFQWYIQLQSNKNQKEKDKAIFDLIKVNIEQTQLMKEQSQQLIEIKQEFMSHTKQDEIQLSDLYKALYSNAERILWSVWKVILPEDKILEVAKKYVWWASQDKIDFLSSMLDIDDIEHWQDEKKETIKIQLIRISREYYIDPLNYFSFKKGLVWQWIRENFPMDSFLEKIYITFFNTKITKTKKIETFINTMRNEQNNMWEKLIVELKE